MSHLSSRRRICCKSLASHGKLFLRCAALPGTTAPPSFVERGWQIWSSSRQPVSRLPSLQRRPSEDSPWEKRFHPTNFLGHNLRGAKSLESASNQSAHACGIDHRSPPTNRRRVSCKPLPTPEKRTPIPKYVKNIFSKCSELVGAPSPHLPRGGGSTENVRKVFGKCSELLGVPSPTPPPGGGSPENARKMFGKCSELGVAPLPHPSSGWWFPRKCSESVQKMLGTCRCPLPPLPRGGGSP